jgi:hypothetical protein
MKNLLSIQLILATLLFWAALAPPASAQAGAEAAKAIIEQLERTNTNGTNDEKVIEELKKVAKKAGEDHPADAAAVKQAVKDHIAKMRGRNHSSGAPGGKNNQGVRDFLNDLENKLKDRALISVPANDWQESGLLISAVGTGQTTGTIGQLTLTNPTRLPIRFAPGALLIPSRGAEQPYIVPPMPPVVVPPGSTIELPVEGMCADVHRPPVGSGQPMPPAEEWVPARPLPAGWSPAPQAGWQHNPNSTVLNPVTGEPLGHTIDPDHYPEEAAPILLEAIERITRAYDEMQGQGLINTPFSNDRDKEREAVIQQTFWIFTAGLTGQEYEPNDFEQKTVEQYEASTGNSVETAPPALRESIQQGAADFWNTFQAVGAEAKVLPSTAPASQEEWGPVAERQYQLYKTYRVMGQGHDEAMRSAIANPTVRERWSAPFRQRYARETR